MMLLTAIQSDQMNEAKAFFEDIPNKSDGNHVPTSSILSAIEGENLSSSSAAAIKKHVDQSGDGKVTFGELAFLIREGDHGLLPTEDRDALRKGLMATPPAAGLRGRFADLPDPDVLDAIFMAFQKHDRGGMGVVPWKDAQAVARSMLEELCVVEQSEIDVLVAELPQKAPNTSYGKLDFQEW